MEIKEKLREEIKSEIYNLSDLAPGSTEHSEAVESVVKLYKLSLEEDKNEADLTEKRKDCSAKADQISNDCKFQRAKLVLEGAGIVLPLVFYAIWMRKGLKFEETGAFTSTTFRGLFQKFKPTK